MNAAAKKKEVALEIPRSKQLKESYKEGQNYEDLGHRLLPKALSIGW
jgi:hypothetical protein